MPKEAQDEYDSISNDWLETYLNISTNNLRMLKDTLKAVEAYDRAFTKYQSILTMSKGCLRRYIRSRENGAQLQPLR